MKLSFSFTFGTLCLLIAFVAAELLARVYSVSIASFVQTQGTMGQVFFVLMAALAVIIPVWSNMFLLPFGVVAWGPLATALLCIIGWCAGSIISFYIARKYQLWVLSKYPSLSKYEFIDTLVPPKNASISLVFLRMTLPVDILSYALGLFSHRISWKQNAITTLIGITPFAFIFSYIGIFNAYLQAGIFISTALLFAIYALKKNNDRRGKNEQQ